VYSFGLQFHPLNSTAACLGARWPKENGGDNRNASRHFTCERGMSFTFLDDVPINCSSTDGIRTRGQTLRQLLCLTKRRHDRTYSKVISLRENGAQGETRTHVHLLRVKQVGWPLPVTRAKWWSRWKSNPHGYAPQAYASTNWAT